MNAGELLGIEPLEISFPFELRKQISCSLQLTNKTDDHIAFKVMTTNPKKYSVRPNNGVILPRSTCDIVVTMKAQKETPPDVQCKDKFLVQSIIVNPGTTAKSITMEMFSRESGNKVEDIKLRVLYVEPPQPPPVIEGYDEGSLPRASTSENGNVHASEPAMQSSAYAHQEISIDTTALIAEITEEKNLAIQLNKMLRGELELLSHGLSKQGGGSFSLKFVAIVTLLGLLLGRANDLKRRQGCGSQKIILRSMNSLKTDQMAGRAASRSNRIGAERICTSVARNKRTTSSAGQTPTTTLHSIMGAGQAYRRSITSHNGATAVTIQMDGPPGGSYMEWL